MLPEPFEENRRKQMTGVGEQLLREKPEYKTASHSDPMQPHMEKISSSSSEIVEASTHVEPIINTAVDHSTIMEQSHSGQMHNNIIKPDAALQCISELDRQASISSDQSFPEEAGTKQETVPMDHFYKEQLQNEMLQKENVKTVQPQSEQLNLFEAPKEEVQAAPFLSREAIHEHRIIGQVFSTYWLVEYKKELFIIDQHAAHEKVLYEKLMKAAREKTFESQLLLPPIVISLTLREQEILKKYKEILNQIGYEFEPFGGNEYSIRAVPADLYGLSEKDLLLEFIDDLTQELGSTTPNPTSVLEKVASLSCKAAIKANHTYSLQEASALIKELLTLENPYNCPHGRPVIISMSQYELEKKFKRIV